MAKPQLPNGFWNLTFPNKFNTLVKIVLGIDTGGGGDSGTKIITSATEPAGLKTGDFWFKITN